MFTCDFTVGVEAAWAAKDIGRCRCTCTHSWCAINAAQKILTLATESLDIMILGAATSVFQESLDKTGVCIILFPPFAVSF